MDFNEYQLLAGRTEKALPTRLHRMEHSLYGLMSETGEIAGPIKAARIYGKTVDEAFIANIREELGDLLWYIALMANACDFNLGNVAEENINKLRTRYPEKYTDENALTRLDKPEEWADIGVEPEAVRKILS